MPGHCRRAHVVALEAQIGTSFWPNLAVWIVARRAIHLSRAADLMRMGNLLLRFHVRVAAETDVRRDRAHTMRFGAYRCHFGQDLLGVVACRIRCRGFCIDWRNFLLGHGW
jgi:hypothetical protein